MHRLIMDFPKGKDIDHKNGNGLDNRRCNLRICSRLENMSNRRGLNSNPKPPQDDTKGYHSKSEMRRIEAMKAEPQDGEGKECGYEERCLECPTDKMDAFTPVWCEKHERPARPADEGQEAVSLCPSCHCMTHTINGLCGKCRDFKKPCPARPVDERWEKELVEIQEQDFQGDAIGADKRLRCLIRSLLTRQAEEHAKTLARCRDEMEKVPRKYSDPRFTHKQNGFVSGFNDAKIKLLAAFDSVLEKGGEV